MAYGLVLITGLLGITLAVAWLVDPSMRGAMRWRRER